MYFFLMLVSVCRVLISYNDQRVIPLIYNLKDFLDLP